jgi:hypothetical protein
VNNAGINGATPIFSQNYFHPTPFLFIQRKIHCKNFVVSMVIFQVYQKKKM